MKMMKCGVVEFKIPELRDLQKVRHTTYSQPTELTHFSYDAQRLLFLSSRQSLQSYTQPSLPLDLNTNYPNDYVVRDSKPEGIESLLRATASLNHKAKFCTWRGIITKIMCTPYSLRDEWQLNATLYHKTIYLEEYESVERQASKFGQYEGEKLQTYYGYKFEACCTNSKQVDTNIQFCSIFKSKLGRFDLLLGGEVDCISTMPIDSSSAEEYQRAYIELKTHKLIRNSNHQRSFIRFKLLKTWAQSFLAGVQNIIFGYKDSDGIVRQIEHFETSALPRLARPDNLWDPNVCLTFCESVMQFLADNISIDDAKVVYEIKYSTSSQSITITGPFSDDNQSFMSKYIEAI